MKQTFGLVVDETEAMFTWTGVTLPEFCSVFFTWGNAKSTVRTPVFDRHQFFSTSEHYGKDHGILLSGWINYYYTACCWFPTSNNIFILPSQFWQIRYESYWLHCSKCRILVLLWYVQQKDEESDYSPDILTLFYTHLGFILNYCYEEKKLSNFTLSIYLGINKDNYPKSMSKWFHTNYPFWWSCVASNICL